MTAGQRRTSEDGIVTRRENPEVIVASLHGSYSPVVLDFSSWSCDAVLRVQLADAVEALTGANGTWKSAYTARGNYVIIKEFARWCGDNDVRSLSELSPPNRWNTYLLHLGKSPTKNNSRRKNWAHCGRCFGVILIGSTRTCRKIWNGGYRRGRVTSLSPLEIDVFETIREAAAAAVNAEFRRIHPNLLLLKQSHYQRLSPQNLARADALGELAATGAPQSDSARNALGIPVHDNRSSGVTRGRPMLFVSYEGAVAIAVLIACLEGANFTQINERKVPSGAPGGLGVAEEILTVEDEKRRRHSDQYDAHVIPKNARRAMTRIIEMTQPARDFLAAHDLPGADRLIVYWPGRGRPKRLPSDWSAAH